MSFGFQSGNSSGGVIPPSLNFGLFAQTSISNIITNTNILSSIIGAGVGTLSVLPNTFSVGDSFSATLGGEVTCQNNTDILIEVLSGSVVLASTGIIRLGSCTNRSWKMNIDFTIRTLGASGVASIVTNGQFTYSRNNTFGFEGVNFNSLNNTTFDTTILNQLDIKVQWAVASPNSLIHSDMLILNKTY